MLSNLHHICLLHDCFSHSKEPTLAQVAAVTASKDGFTDVTNECAIPSFVHNNQ